jgi:hypothetical protein
VSERVAYSYKPLRARKGERKMTKKKLYFAVTVKVGDKKYSTVSAIDTSVNFARCFNAEKCEFVAYCDTKKQAVAIVDAWNNEWRKRGILYW